MEAAEGSAPWACLIPTQWGLDGAPAWLGYGTKRMGQRLSSLCRTLQTVLQLRDLETGPAAGVLTPANRQTEVAAG